MPQYPGFVNVPSSLGEIASIQHGPNIVRETTLLIENVIMEDNLVEAIYDCDEIRSWLAENGKSMIDFGGGEFGISVEMLADCPPSILKYAKFSNGRPIGPKRAAGLHVLLQEALNREPFV